MADGVAADPLAEVWPVLAGLVGASVQGRVALGPVPAPEWGIILRVTPESCTVAIGRMARPLELLVHVERVEAAGEPAKGPGRRPPSCDPERPIEAALLELQNSSPSVSSSQGFPP